MYMDGHSYHNDDEPIRIAQTDEDILEGAVQIAADIDVEKIAIFHDTLYALSEDAKEVVKLIIATPHNLTELLVTATHDIITKRTLDRFLRQYYMWPVKRVMRAFTEIEDALKQQTRTSKFDFIKEILIVYLEYSMANEPKTKRRRKK
jgi:hypothetical protein